MSENKTPKNQPVTPKVPKQPQQPQMPFERGTKKINQPYVPPKKD